MRSHLTHINYLRILFFPRKSLINPDYKEVFLKICRFIGLALFLSSGTLLAQEKDTASNDASLIQTQQAKPGFLSLLDDDESEALASKRATDSTLVAYG